MEPLPAPPALPPLDVKLGDAGANLLLMPRYPEPAAPDARDSGLKQLHCAWR